MLINEWLAENKNILLFLARELSVWPFFVSVASSIVDGPSTQFELDCYSMWICLLITFVGPLDLFLFRKHLLRVESYEIKNINGHRLLFWKCLLRNGGSEDFYLLFKYEVLFPAILKIHNQHLLKLYFNLAKFFNFLPIPGLF